MQVNTTRRGHFTSRTNAFKLLLNWMIDVHRQRHGTRVDENHLKTHSGTRGSAKIGQAGAGRWEYTV